MSTNYLTAKSNTCNTCEKSLPITGDYVKCHFCGCKYHYNPCCTLSESTYMVMNMEKKLEWKCRQCRGERNKSPKNSVSDGDQEYEQQTANKQQREDDDEPEYDPNATESTSKRFKEALSLTTINDNLTKLISNVNSFKSAITGDIDGIKSSICQLNCSVTESNNQLRAEMSNAYAKLVETMTALSSQVIELKKQNIEQENRIQTIENKNNTFEQQRNNRSVEIKNVPNKELSPEEVIKQTAASIDVTIQDSDR